LFWLRAVRGICGVDELEGAAFPWVGLAGCDSCRRGKRIWLRVRVAYLVEQGTRKLRSDVCRRGRGCGALSVSGGRRERCGRGDRVVPWGGVFVVGEMSLVSARALRRCQMRFRLSRQSARVL